MEQASDLKEFLIQGCSSLGIALSARQISLFSCYHRELVRWNEKINLTAITEVKDIAIKHFVDSMACGKALKTPLTGAALLDIGTGAGFPALPLKILHPDLHLTLLEPNHKKTAFLRHVIGTLEMQNVHAFSQTVKEFSKLTGHHGEFSYVTTRALNVQPFVHYVEPLLRDDGKFILCRSLPMDTDQVGFTVAQETPYTLPYGAGKRVLTVLNKEMFHVEHRDQRTFKRK